MLANAGFPPVRFSVGDVIFAEGDRGDAMYVVRNGEVTIERRGTVAARPLSPDTPFLAF